MKRKLLAGLGSFALLAAFVVYREPKQKEVTSSDVIGLYQLSSASIMKLESRGYRFERTPTFEIGEREFSAIDLPSCVFERRDAEVVSAAGQFRFDSAWNTKLTFSEPHPFGTYSIQGGSFRFERRRSGIVLLVTAGEPKTEEARTPLVYEKRR